MHPHPNNAVESLQPYEPGLALEQVAARYAIPLDQVVKLASNENPRGPSPQALEVLQHYTDAHRYPDQYTFLTTLATTLQITSNMILLGNGSNDVLDLIARVYLGPDDEAISSEYSFIMYQLATQTAGATNVVIPSKDYGHNLQAMQRAITPATKIIWLANPNNPTGTFISYATIHHFLAQVPSTVIVVLDEAYYDYLTEDQKDNALTWINEFPNLIVVRTFSKIYGLAGLRIGYGVASPPVADYLNRIRQPFNVNGVALAAAQAALSDTEFVRQSAQTNAQERTHLLQELTARQLECMPAHGNFVTFKLPPATHAHEALLRQGVIVRPLANYYLADWLRVTVGTPAENQQFLHALHTYLNQAA